MSHWDGSWRHLSKNLKAVRERTTGLLRGRLSRQRGSVKVLRQKEHRRPGWLDYRGRGDGDTEVVTKSMAFQPMENKWHKSWWRVKHQGIPTQRVGKKGVWEGTIWDRRNTEGRPAGPRAAAFDNHLWRIGFQLDGRGRGRKACEKSGLEHWLQKTLQN